MWNLPLTYVKRVVLWRAFPPTLPRQSLTTQLDRARFFVAARPAILLSPDRPSTVGLPVPQRSLPIGGRSGGSTLDLCGPRRINQFRAMRARSETTSKATLL